MSDDLRHFDELVQRYIEGTLDDKGAEELMEALQGNPELGEQVVRELRMESLLRSEVPWVEEEIGRQLAEEFRRKGDDEARGAKQTPVHFHWMRRMAAVAAVLLIVAGLFALWLIPPPASPSWTVSKERREQIQEQLRELNQERNALRLAMDEPSPGTTPVEPVPGEPSPFAIDRENREVTEAALRREEAGECARLLDMRRLLLEAELGGGRRPEEPDEESGARIVVAQLPVSDEAGRVVHVEGEASSAVLVRAVDSQRVDLKAGEKLSCGDRIVVERGAHQASARIELKAGATIDLAVETTLKVVDRNAVRLEAGHVYACVSRPVVADEVPAREAPFTLQTPCARYLMEEAQVEIYASPLDQTQASTARVDRGQVHLLTGKGHVLGKKGQELHASASAAPVRRDGFSKPIWRGRNSTNPGLPIGRDNPVLVGNDDTERHFNLEYALALAHTGEIDLRGIQVTNCLHGDPEARWRDMVWEVDRLRQSGLRVTPPPVLGAIRFLQRPASGRCEDTIPERSPAVEQLLREARKAPPQRPLVVVASGALTDLASAWLLDHGMAERTVVITRGGYQKGFLDPWAFTIVLEKYPCVICAVQLPNEGLKHLTRLGGTRWAFLAERAKISDSDFSQFACVTVPGFVRLASRARFVRGTSQDLSDYTFKPDPNGQTWLVERTDDQSMVREIVETFQKGSNVP